MMTLNGFRAPKFHLSHSKFVAIMTSAYAFTIVKLYVCLPIKSLLVFVVFFSATDFSFFFFHILCTQQHTRYSFCFYMPLLMKTKFLTGHNNQMKPTYNRMEVAKFLNCVACLRILCFKKEIKWAVFCAFSVVIRFIFNVHSLPKFMVVVNL